MVYLIELAGGISMEARRKFRSPPIVNVTCQPKQHAIVDPLDVSAA